VKNIGLFGIRRAQRTAAPKVQLVAPPPFTTESPVSPVTGFGSFDADSYRREMTDLVYQRNMQRLHVN
jgi:hypothetical protein